MLNASIGYPTLSYFSIFFCSKKMDLFHPIAYLERVDFDDNGDLKGPASKTPVFIMIQGSYCGACTTAKPVFQKLANEKIITCMTIQVDGERESEKELQEILNNIYPNLSTIPNYILYVDKHTRIPYKGDSTNIQEMRAFIKKHLPV